MTDPGLQELYEARAEWVDTESEITDARKYVRVGGVLDRILDWLERKARSGRMGVQAEIDEALAARQESD